MAALRTGVNVVMSQEWHTAVSQKARLITQSTLQAHTMLAQAFADKFVTKYVDRVPVGLAEEIVRRNKYSLNVGPVRVTLVVNACVHDDVDTVLRVRCPAEPVSTEESAVLALVNDLCFELMLRSSKHNVVRYISRNVQLCNQMPHMTHIITFMKTRGALFFVPSVWHRLITCAARPDICSLTKDAMAQFAAITTHTTQHQILARLLTATSHIDCRTSVGQTVAHEIWDICARSANGAEIISSLSESSCVEHAATCITEKAPDASTRACICFRVDNFWHLLVLRDYDLLFVWLALLFDASMSMYWRTKLSDWGPSAAESPVPTLWSVLQWRDSQQQQHPHE